VSLALEPAAIEAVLNELRTYIQHGDKAFACAAIRAVGRVTELTRIVYDRHGASTGRPVEERKTANQIALDALYGLTIITQTSDSKAVVGESVSAMHNILLLLGSSNVVSDGQSVIVEDPNQVQSLAIRRILILIVNAMSSRLVLEDENQDKDDEEDVDQETELSKLSVDLPPAAFSSALWIQGEWLTNSPSLSSSTMTLGSQNTIKARLELARLIGRCFLELGPEEKEQAIHFASKLWMSNAITQSLSTSVNSSSTADVSMCEHILSMGRVDVNPAVKDRARYESSILHSCTGLKFDSDGMDERPGGVSIPLEAARKILASKKPSSSYIPIDDGATVDMSSFRFGTLSSLVGHRARGAYLPLPNWAEKNSPSALREPIETAKEQLAPNFADPSQPQMTGSSGFYADDNDSESDSSSSSSSSSESGGQNADSESDSDSDDESTSSESSNQGNLLLPMVQQNGQAQHNLLLQPIANQPPKPAVPAYHPNLSSQNSSDDELSTSSSDSTNSSDSSDANYNGDVSTANLLMSSLPHTTSNTGNLLGPMNSAGFSPIPEVSHSGRSSAMDDLKGLVMAPIVVPDPAANQPDSDRDSSAWTQLVRPELCGGLSVKMRYLRGTTREKELQMMNIPASNPCFVCVQVQFGNKRTDTTSLRRIKVLPRSGSSGPYATKKILCPPEVLELKTGQVSTSLMVLEFASTSNRDGDLVGRIEIKQGSAGSVPVEVKPSLGELLRPPKKTSSEEFDSTLKRMQGFQRVESTFNATADAASIEKSVMKASSLTKVGGKGDKLRFIATLPASDDLVLVQVQIGKEGTGKIIVCCDHAVAINSILSLVKSAVS
jgi:AP-3 complex subunit beta